MINLQEMAAIAVRAAKEAGKFLLESSSQKQEVLLNKGRDIKLKIDQDAEDIIKDILSNESDHPILAEESADSEHIAETYWVVDPLDGTSNFYRGIPICCVSIGLVHDEDPVLGTIFDFLNDDLYLGYEGSTAIKNDETINVSNINSSQFGTLVTGIPAKTNYTDKEFQNMINDFQLWKKVRMIGSAAMASTYVASGKAECYKELGIYIWDVAAGAAIVRAAGGSIILDKLGDHKVNAIFSNGFIPSNEHK